MSTRVFPINICLGYFFFADDDQKYDQMTSSKETLANISQNIVPKWQSIEISLVNISKKIASIDVIWKTLADVNQKIVMVNVRQKSSLADIGQKTLAKVGQKIASTDVDWRNHSWHQQNSSLSQR